MYESCYNAFIWGIGRIWKYTNENTKNDDSVTLKYITTNYLEPLIYIY